tara:strand:+ start:148 stop:558 length:411 start_codon:yes stop_codon:yes gene_type:complete
MIQLTRGQVNNFYVSLQEKRISSTTTTIYYLIEFTNIMTNSAVYVVASTISSNARYDKLRITESNTPDAPNGTQTLEPVGFFNYIIYEQTSSTNINPSDASVKGIVERGLAYVQDSTPEFSYTEYNPSNTNNVYVP